MHSTGATELKDRRGGAHPAISPDQGGRERVWQIRSAIAFRRNRPGRRASPAHSMLQAGAFAESLATAAVPPKPRRPSPIASALREYQSDARCCPDDRDTKKPGNED